MPLSAADIRKVLDFVGEAHGADDLEELRAYLPSGLGNLVLTDYASYNEVGVDGTVHVAITIPEIPAELVAEWQRYAAHGAQAHRAHPLEARHARPRAGDRYGTGGRAGSRGTVARTPRLTTPPARCKK